jgi:hypothetical protein
MFHHQGVWRVQGLRSGDEMTAVVSSPEVPDLVRGRGGRLFVWTELKRCCGGGITYLRTGTDPARGRAFHRIEADGFELWLAASASDPPDELHLEVKGRRGRKRVEAYWNGCVFAV